MYDEIVILVTADKTKNEYGDMPESSSERMVFAELKSIGQSEFYQAQTAGLKPEMKFVLADYLDYRDEKQLKYKPYNGVEETYTVIRTYRTGNELEIVCKKGIEK